MILNDYNYRKKKKYTIKYHELKRMFNKICDKLLLLYIASSMNGWSWSVAKDWRWKIFGGF